MNTEFWAGRLKTIFDGWEVCRLEKRTKKFEAAEGKLLSMDLNEEQGISCRGVKDRRMSFAYTFEKGEKAAEAVVENISALIPFLDADPYSVFPAAYERYPDLDIYDEAGLRTADNAKIEALMEMESIIRGHDRRISQTRNCELQETELRVEMINSRGVEAQAKKTVYTLGAMAVAQEGGDEVSWYDWSWGTRYVDLNGRTLGRRIAEKAVSGLAGRVLPTGVYPGLLTPAAACQILEVLSASFLAENLHKKKTRLADKIGTRCFSEALTIIDSGLRGMGAFPFDGEGVPSQENILVKEGVFQTFLYDAYYGKRMEKTSTGNSVRWGVKDPPKCDSRGFFIDAGGDAPIAESGGVVVEELMGVHMANAITGDFSLGATGDYYSEGKRRPLRG